MDILLLSIKFSCQIFTMPMAVCSAWHVLLSAPRMHHLGKFSFLGSVEKVLQSVAVGYHVSTSTRRCAVLEFISFLHGGVREDQGARCL